MPAAPDLVVLPMNAETLAAVDALGARMCAASREAVLAYLLQRGLDDTLRDLDGDADYLASK